MRLETRRVQAGIYCRISDDRAGGGLGVERQRLDCEALAARLGWSVADTYLDNDISAYSGKRRPQYERLMEDISTGLINGLVIWHPDRLNRSPVELEYLIDILERKQVAVQSVTAGVIDLGTPSGRAVARTLGVWARYESEHKSERIKAKKLQSAMTGAPGNGPHRPYGYAADWVTIVPEEAKIIREGVHRFLAGASLPELRIDFDRRGTRTPAGNPWHTSSLAMVFASARICGWRDTPASKGTRRPTGTPFLARAQWPAIVSRADVERVRALLADETMRPGSSSRWLLSGIMLCSRCEVPMIAKASPSRTLQYQCFRGQNQVTAKCGRTSITGLVEADIVGRLFEAVKTGLVQRVLAAGSTAFDRPGAALRANERRLHEVDVDHRNGDLTRQEWLDRRRWLNRRIRGNHVSAADIATPARMSEMAAQSATFPAAWAVMTMREQRTLLRTLTCDIRVLPHPGGWAPYNPARVLVTWRI